MKNINKRLFYIAYTLVAIGCFLYFLFPSETFKEAVSGYLSRTLPAYQIKIDRLRPVLPLGLGFSPVAVMQNKRLWVQIDTLTVSPRLATLLSPRKTINFSGAAYQGDLRGHIGFYNSDEGNQTELFLQAICLPILNYGDRSLFLF